MLYWVAACLFVWFSMAVSQDPTKVNTVGEAANTLHLVPFSCSFLGIPLSELDGCSIACPGSVFAAHELGQFTASLSCTHPKYELLQCGIDR